MHMHKETVLRTTATLPEGERPEFRSGKRSTFVVTRAVLEDTIGGRRMLAVWGYRKENPRDQARDEPRWAEFDLDRGCPVELHPLVRQLEAGR